MRQSLFTVQGGKRILVILFPRLVYLSDVPNIRLNGAQRSLFNESAFYRQWRSLRPRVTFTGWKTDKWPALVKVHRSHDMASIDNNKCLSDIPAVGTRLGNDAKVDDTGNAADIAANTSHNLHKTKSTPGLFRYKCFSACR